MNKSETNSRRNFIKQASLSSIAAVSIPGLLLAATEDKFRDKNKGDDYVFVFQGDSITDGNRGRNNDLNHIMGHGYAYSIASRLGADLPNKNLKFYNRGISGNKVPDLGARWQQDTLDLKPNVLSILVGINDAHVAIDQKGSSVEKYQEGYKALLDQTKAAFPNVVFVLCEPFILPAGIVKSNWAAWHAEVLKLQEVVKSLAKQYNAVFVGFQAVFDLAWKEAPADYWIWDGIHPTVAGHELMAREWIKEVKKRLTFIG